jgi:hypothetical protein
MSSYPILHASKIGIGIWFRLGQKKNMCVSDCMVFKIRVGRSGFFFFETYKHAPSSKITQTCLFLSCYSLLPIDPKILPPTITFFMPKKKKIDRQNLEIRLRFRVCFWLQQFSSTTIDIHYMFDRLNNRCGLIISLRFYHLIYVVYVSRSIATLKKQNKKQTIVIWNMWRSWKIWTVTSQQFLFHIISWICCHQCFVHF